MESCIKQNNAIEIYEVSSVVLDYFTVFIAQDYFNEVDEATDCEEPKAKTVNLYRLVESSDTNMENICSLKRSRSS